MGHGVLGTAFPELRSNDSDLLLRIHHDTGVRGSHFGFVRFTLWRRPCLNRQDWSGSCLARSSDAHPFCCSNPTMAGVRYDDVFAEYLLIFGSLAVGSALHLARGRNGYEKARLSKLVLDRRGIGLLPHRKCARGAYACAHNAGISACFSGAKCSHDSSGNGRPCSSVSAGSQWLGTCSIAAELRCSARISKYH